MGAALIPAAIQGALGIGQFVAGLFGKKSIKKVPEYTIPTQLNDNLRAAQTLKNMGMPTAEYDRAANSIDRNLTFGLSSLQDRRGGIGGLARLVRGTNDAYSQLSATAANMRMRNYLAGTQFETSANSALAEQQLQKQNWEKFMPYNRKVQEVQGLLGAGLQNIGGAVNSATSIFSAGAGAGGGLFGK